MAGLVALLLAACGDTALDPQTSGPTAEWPSWGGDDGAAHFSPLTQITPENVDQLEVAWEHRSGDFFDGSGNSTYTALQVTPIVVNDLLYYCTPFMRVFALDPETGEERWSFDPELKARGSGGPYPLTCRGVSYWQAANPQPGRACDKRIFLGTKDSELIALDADSGLPCLDFGASGRVALREGMGESEPWEYYPTSPPLIIGNTLVLGALVADNVRTDVPSGVVRAFDVRSGERVWAWDPVPPGWSWEARAQDGKWAPGSPNVWSIITADRDRDLVFVPTGNPSPDIYGGQRDGIDHYGSSTVALDARTGAVRWNFQTVHNDVWDYDTPSPPTLFQIDGVGGGRPGVAQTTKMGFVFLLDRETGEPLYPVEERPVPQGGVPGEQLSPTQPFPTHPGPLHTLDLSADSVFGFTFFERMACARTLEKYRWEGIYTPPSLEGSIQFPNTGGGMNWGGVAIDEERGLLIVNQNHVAMMVQLIPREEVGSIDPSELQYPSRPSVRPAMHRRGER
jgi:quinoprotein glucose dehydrogenase